MAPKVSKQKAAQSFLAGIVIGRRPVSEASAPPPPSLPTSAGSPPEADTAANGSSPPTHADAAPAAAPAPEPAPAPAAPPQEAARRTSGHAGLSVGPPPALASKPPPPAASPDHAAARKRKAPKPLGRREQRAMAFLSSISMASEGGVAKAKSDSAIVMGAAAAVPGSAAALVATLTAASTGSMPVPAAAVAGSSAGVGTAEAEVRADGDTSASTTAAAAAATAATDAASKARDTATPMTADSRFDASVGGPAVDASLATRARTQSAHVPPLSAAPSRSDTAPSTGRRDDSDAARVLRTSISSVGQLRATVTAPNVPTTLRMMLVTQPPARRRTMPFAMASVLRYDDGRGPRKKRQGPYAPADLRRKPVAGAQKTANPSILQSFHGVVSPRRGVVLTRPSQRVVSHEAAISSAATRKPYDPNYLDDPELRSGRFRKVMRMPFVMATLIPYVRPDDLRRELNERFRDSHPEIDPSITLSKIRRLKELMIEVGQEVDIEAATIACAFSFMERLIISGVVNKANRKLVAAACLLLAAKVNDPKFVINGNFPPLFDSIEKHIDVSLRDVMDYEFAVFAALDFDVHPPPEEILPHFYRIVSSFNRYSNVQEYLGEKMHSIFFLDEKA